MVMIRQMRSNKLNNVPTPTCSFGSLTTVPCDDFEYGRICDSERFFCTSLVIALKKLPIPFAASLFGSDLAGSTIVTLDF
jgi:hypothetical protein